MPNCPKCNAEIDHLDQFVPAEAKFKFFLDKKNGEPKAHFLAHTNFEEDGDFECPECGETLTSDEEDALAILKGAQIE